MTSSPRDVDVELPTRWLDVAVLGVSAAAAFLLILVHGLGPLQVAAVAALALLVIVWWALRPDVLEGGRGWPLLLGVLVLACLLGALTSPAFATFQVLALPLAWLLAPGTRSSIGANVAVVVVIGAGTATFDPVSAIVVQSLSFAFSMAIGLWIGRIQTRSASRQALIDRLTATQAQVAQLHRDAGAVAEREHLARELHDTLAQSLTGIVMLSERARSRHPDDAALEVLEDAARVAMGEARALVTATTTVPLTGGLAAAIAELAARFRRETGLDVHVDVHAEVPRDLEVVLLRCAQEGLANVRKHAGARSVDVRIADDDGSALLTVADDGAGPGSGDGFGLAGMRDRLAALGGAVRLEPGERTGARLVVRVPVAEASS